MSNEQPAIRKNMFLDHLNAHFLLIIKPDR